MVGRLAAKADNPVLAEQLWGHEPELPRSLLYFLEDVQFLDVERELGALRLGYSRGFVPGGLIVPVPSTSCARPRSPRRSWLAFWRVPLLECAMRSQLLLGI